MIANINKNSPGYEYQSSSMVKRISGGTESGKSETGRGK